MAYRTRRGRSYARRSPSYRAPTRRRAPARRTRSAGRVSGRTQTVRLVIQQANPNAVMPTIGQVPVRPRSARF